MAKQDNFTTSCGRGWKGFNFNSISQHPKSSRPVLVKGIFPLALCWHEWIFLHGPAKRSNNPTRNMWAGVWAWPPYKAADHLPQLTQLSLESHWPLWLGELVILLMLLIIIEVENTLNEVLEEHGRISLQQQVSQAKLPETAKEGDYWLFADSQ